MGVRQYIGARYVPKMFENNGSSEWVSGITYEPLTIVTYLNNSYTSKKPVPSSVGSPNLNGEYWVNTGDFSGAITSLTERINAVDEELEEFKPTAINDYATPQMYGAKGDGVTDDTEAIQQCIRENPITHIPCGTYIISDTIEIPERHEVHMQGHVETFLTTLMDRIDTSMFTVIKCNTDVTMFELNNGSKIYDGVIWGEGTTKVMHVDIGTKEISNIVLTCGILGSSTVENNIGIHFDGSTGTTGYLCISTFDCAIAWFDKAYFFDRPTGAAPWITFLKFGGNFFNNRKGITNNFTNYGFSGGGSIYECMVSGGYIESEDAIFDITGDNNYVDIKVSDIGPTHNQKYALDISHIYGGCVIVNDIFADYVKARNAVSVVCDTPIHTITEGNCTLSYAKHGNAITINIKGNASAGLTTFDVPFTILGNCGGDYVISSNLAIRLSGNDHYIRIVNTTGDTASVQYNMTFLNL